MEARANIVKYFDSKGIDVTTEGAWNMDIGDISEGYFPMFYHFSSEQMSLSLTASQANGVNCGIRAFGNNINGEQTFMKAGSIGAGFDEFKKGFCEKSLICQYLNTFGRKALIKGENGKTWTVPSGVEFPRNAKAWTIDQDGRTSFSDFRIKGRQVTLSLAPGQMVLIEQ